MLDTISSNLFSHIYAVRTSGFHFQESNSQKLLVDMALVLNETLNGEFPKRFEFQGSCVLAVTDNLSPSLGGDWALFNNL